MISIRDIKIATIAAFAVMAGLALLQLLAAGVAALPMAWLLGTSQLGLALAKIGPYILLNFLAMLLSMWVYLRLSHVRFNPGPEPARPKAAADTYRVSASYDG
jgi:hypothetical protein